MGILWSQSGQIAFDNNSDRAPACEAKFFVGGTTTPFTVYSNAAESTAHAHPLVADANGRWPLVFIPYTATYDVQIVTSGGVQLYYYQNIPNTDPVEDVADAVDATELIQTGDWKFTTKGGTLDGFVRANGRTIGSAASGATERANDDCADLYTFLWDNHANGILAVSTGRGASAAADFAANKTIALFDCRSAHPMGVDDMGNSAAGIGFGGTFTTGNATTGGSVCGANTHALVTGELAAHNHSAGSLSTSSDGAHTHVITIDSGGSHSHGGVTSGATSSLDHVHNGFVFSDNGAVTAGTGAGTAQAQGDNVASAVSSNTSSLDHIHNIATSTDGAHIHGASSSSAGSHSHTVANSTASTGSGTAHNNVAKAVLGSWYIKI